MTLEPASAAAAPARARIAGAPLIVEEKPICRAALWQVLAAAGFEGPPRFAASVQATPTGELDGVRLVVVDLFTINYDFAWLGALAARVRPPVVAIDDRANPAFSDLARAAGAAAYGSKDQPVAALEALFAEAAGGAWASGPPTLGADAGARVRRLTRRQREVLAQLGQGRTTREIAELLAIAPGTVKLHIHHILRVTGARNRTEAALISTRFLAVPLPASGDV